MTRNLGELPINTELTGRLLYGPDRLYGRFTEARTEKGEVYPVCLELRDRYDEGKGTPMKLLGDGSAVIKSSLRVKAVDRFW
jgi:serine/threonine-protein kinase